MEEKEKTNLEIEKAKSWFILAQITIILAGFMFASSGIYWTNTISTMEYSTNVNNKAVELTLNNDNNLTLGYIQSLTNLTTKLNDLTKSQLDISGVFFYFGWVLSGISFFFWIFSRYKLYLISKRISY